MKILSQRIDLAFQNYKNKITFDCTSQKITFVAKVVEFCILSFNLIFVVDN